MQTLINKELCSAGGKNRWKGISKKKRSEIMKAVVANRPNVKAKREREKENH